MLIACLTTDEINLDLADRLATECGAILHLLSFKESTFLVYTMGSNSGPWC